MLARVAAAAAAGGHSARHRAPRAAVAAVSARRALSAASSEPPRVVIVTGGAKGIGQGVVESFAASAMRDPSSPPTVVYSFDVDEEAGARQAEALGGLVRSVVCDVSKQADVSAAVERVFREKGRIDVLVNNAGIQPVPSCVPLHELPDDLWDRVLAVNLTGMFRMSKQCLPVMLEQAKAESAGPGKRGPGVIINISSVQGLQSQAGVPAYAASKGGAGSLTRQMAMEYGPYGIRVVAVNPGTVRTPLVADLLPNGGSDEDWAAAGSVYPLNARVGEISEVGDACVFLASPSASYVTGCALEVDGGIMAKGGWNT